MHVFLCCCRYEWYKTKKSETKVTRISACRMRKQSLFSILNTVNELHRLIFRFRIHSHNKSNQCLPCAVSEMICARSILFELKLVTVCASFSTCWCVAFHFEWARTMLSPYKQLATEFHKNRTAIRLSNRALFRYLYILLLTWNNAQKKLPDGNEIVDVFVMDFSSNVTYSFGYLI